MLRPPVRTGFLKKTMAADHRTGGACTTFCDGREKEPGTWNSSPLSGFARGAVEFRSPHVIVSATSRVATNVDRILTVHSFRGCRRSAALPAAALSMDLRGKMSFCDECHLNPMDAVQYWLETDVCSESATSASCVTRQRSSVVRRPSPGNDSVFEAGGLRARKRGGRR